MVRPSNFIATGVADLGVFALVAGRDMRLVIDLQGAQAANHARGIGRNARELALAMAHEPRGHEVVVALSSAFADTAEDLADAFGAVLPRSQIRVWHPPAGLAGSADDAPARRVAEGLRTQFLTALQPDLVHVPSLFEGQNDAAVTVLAPAMAGLPVVATCHDLIPLIRHQTYFGDSATSSPAARWYYRRVHEMSLCEGLLAVSESSRGEAIRHLPFPPERVFVVPNGVGGAFRPLQLAGEARAELLSRYRLRDSFVLFLGAGDPRKNEGGLIEAFARLPADLRARHQLAIVGHADEAELKRGAARLGLAPNSVVGIARVAEDDLAALYSACTVFVFPSLHEGFGLPVAEAMACGAPVIVSNTTSLPEVVGRDDATFDPADPAAIAASLRRVLEDARFRTELAAHGPLQAARFTWRGSAAMAWDGIEQIARRCGREAPRRRALPGTRPRLAFVSPLPPQPSGVADYSRDLLPSLARHYEITLVCEAEVGDIRLAAAFPRLTPADFLCQSHSFDRVLYQIGNSAFHTFQIEDLLPLCPGMVVLHDAFLSGLLNWRANTQGKPRDFSAALWRSHGYQALRYEAEAGDMAAVRRYPCCLPVLQAALGVILHSRHAAEILTEHFGPAAVRHAAIIAHLRAPRVRPDRRAARARLGIAEGEFLTCSFGGLNALKRPGLVVEGWRRSGLAGRLMFVGDVPAELRETVTDPQAGIGHTGRLAQEDYETWLAAADLAVQWRTGSRGESSGAVADALSAGVPLIVNRHGAAAELPDGVALALPDEADAAMLAEALVALHGDAARRTALADAGRRHALRDLAPETIARGYRDAIEAAYATDLPARVAQRLRGAMNGSTAWEKAIPATARAIADTLPHPLGAGGRPRLLIDMSELARRDALSGVQRVVRELGRRVLAMPPAGHRGEAVRIHDGRVRYTHAVPLRILGLAPLALPEAPIDTGATDVLICADINPDMTEQEFAELRRMRLAGARIVLVVHDLLPLRQPHFFPEGIVRVAEWYVRMLSIADVAACTSRVGADELAAWLDEHRTVRRAKLPIGVFHLGADFPVAADSQPPAVGVAAALSAMRARPSVLMIGTIEPRKGHAQALAAFEQLWRDSSALGLVIVGKQGWQVEKLIAHLRASPELGDRLHWLTACTDTEMQQLHHAAAGLLMASRQEGFGLPIVEAARVDLPVLARDIPVFREVAGTHARYFQGDEAADLAEALRVWQADGFTPTSAGMSPLTWDESYHQLCAILFEDRYDRIWRP